MLRLNRAINLYVELPAGKLHMGQAQNLSLAQVPLVLWVRLEGPASGETGMVVNVVDIDQSVGQALAEREFRPKHAIEILRWARQVMTRNFGKLKVLRLELACSETLRVAWSREHKEMTEITARYDFAASHRLWNAAWSERENYEVFGKCANPSGHGHNYLLEITLRGDPDEHSGRVAHMEQVGRIVAERVIERFDHKTLNEDTEEFSHLIPTVENMAKVFWQRLVGQFGQAKLVRVAVWETAKTYAEFFGP